MGPDKQTSATPARTTRSRPGHLTERRSPSPSAKGSQIVFRSDRERDNADPVPQVWVMNSDGSGQTDLSNNNGGDYVPDWQHGGGAPPPSNGATFVSQNVPISMLPGHQY